MTRHVEINHRTQYRQLNCGDGYELVEVVLEAEDYAVGRSLKEMRGCLPHDCVLVSLRRQEQVLIPHGYTLFQDGDHISAFLRQRDVEELFDGLKQGVAFAPYSKTPVIKKSFHRNTERQGPQG